MALSSEEQALVKKLVKKLNGKRPNNQENYRFYYQKNLVPLLGVKDPRKQRALSFMLGWGSQAVDLPAQRINFLNFFNETNAEWVKEVNNVFHANDFSNIENAIKRDAGTVGTTYASVWYGDKDNNEPEIFMTAESPISTYGEMNLRSGLLDVAIQLTNMGGEYVATLYTKNETIICVRDNKGNWNEIERIEHGLNQVPIFQYVNDADTMYPRGKTEITPALKSIIQDGIRAFSDSSRIRSYYSDPMFFLSGLETKNLKDANGNDVTNISQLADSIINLPYNENNDYAPTLQQITANDPNVALETVDRLAKLAAREIGVSPSQYGFDTVNPPSAEAMNEADKGLILKVNQRIPQYSKTNKQIARFVLKLKEIEVPEQELATLDTVFKRPSTPTPASFADYMSKMQAVGIFDRELPSFVYRGMEMSNVEILELKNWLDNNPTTEPEV